MPPFILLLLLFSWAYSQPQSLQPDAVSLLAFKSKADLDNSLLYALHEPYDYCQWQGAKCEQGGRVVRLSLPSSRLRGTFPPNTLSNLSHLRVLNLQNNSLSGPLPDLSPLFNLISLSLSHNSFSGSFTPSILSLHRLTILDLSFNNLSGPIPPQLSLLGRLSSLNLQFNRLNGPVPPLNQTFLNSFNVSGNELSGAIPVTPTLSRFGASSFSSNPALCGEIVNKACKDRSPFFDPNSTSSSSSGQSAQAEGGGGGGAAVVVVVSPPSNHNQRKRLNGVALGATVAVSLLAIALVATFFVILLKRATAAPGRNENSNPKHADVIQVIEQHKQQEQQNELEAVVTVAMKAQDRKSGRLVFCQGGEGSGGELFSLERLMGASAELLGRGTVGTTYKAVLDNRLAVTVKRLDAGKSWVTSREAFQRHMEVVGGTRHPNLVPLVAYLQAKGERLVVYEYQPNGSLFNLIHGSRSARAKPLHWTSCLKIAEDVAQGLAHIHQVSQLVHGNLKSSNVLLGADFEARITDCCLAILADASSVEDPDSAACKAPETCKPSRRPTAKSDVYAFGVLLLELLTGKHPSQHPFLTPADMLDWVIAMRDDDSGDYNQIGMLTEVASVCSLTSPQQRPETWQVLKMIQEIKESALVENEADPGYLSFFATKKS